MKYEFCDIKDILCEKDILDFFCDRGNVSLIFYDDTKMVFCEDKVIYEYGIVTDIVSISKKQMRELTDIVEEKEKKRFKNTVRDVFASGIIDVQNDQIKFSLGERSVILTRDKVSGYVNGKLSMESASEPSSYDTIVSAVLNRNED